MLFGERWVDKLAKCLFFLWANTFSNFFRFHSYIINWLLRQCCPELNDGLVHEYKNEKCLHVRGFGGQFECPDSAQKSRKLPADKKSWTCNLTQPALFAKCMAKANKMRKAYIIELAIDIAVKRKCVLLQIIFTNAEKNRSSIFCFFLFPSASFLDASSHLCKRVCPSVCPFVHPSTLRKNRRKQREASDCPSYEREMSKRAGKWANKQANEQTSRQMSEHAGEWNSMLTNEWERGQMSEWAGKRAGKWAYKGKWVNEQAN